MSDRKKYKFTYHIARVEQTGTVEVPARDFFSAQEQARKILVFHQKANDAPVDPNEIELTSLVITADA